MQAAYLYQYFEQSISKRRIWFLLLLFFAINLVFYSINSNWATSIPPVSKDEIPVQMLDLFYGYSPELAYQMISAYGPNNRMLYLITVLTLDMFYPLVYTLLFIWGGIWLLKKSYPLLINDLYKLTFLPLIALFADIFENISIASILICYPNKFSILAHISNFFTMLKWISIMLIMTLYILGIIAYWMNHRQTAEYKQKS